MTVCEEDIRPRDEVHHRRAIQAQRSGGEIAASTAFLVCGGAPVPAWFDRGDYELRPGRTPRLGSGLRGSEYEEASRKPGHKPSGASKSETTLKRRERWDLRVGPVLARAQMW